MNDLIQKYRPYCVFHPNEKYKPVSADFYIQNSRLVKGTPPTQEMILNIGDVTTESLTEYNRSDYDLQLGAFAWNGMENAPYYCHVAEFDNYIDLQYIFLYGFNGSFSICSCGSFSPFICLKNCGESLHLQCDCLDCTNVGSHIHDLEHITVRINKNGELLKVYFGAHQAKDGLWKDKNDVSFVNQTHVKVYIARGSHATYPKGGCWPRAFCTINDYTGDGDIWFPDNVPVINDAIWNLWQGSYDTADTPARKDWYKQEEPSSTNFWKRLCCPCLNEKNECFLPN